jgi:hypothetical protein
MPALPDDISALVWNDDAADPGISDEVVVMAVLRVGTWDQIRWAFATYGRDVGVGVIERDYFGMRTLPLSVRNFWGREPLSCPRSMLIGNELG